MTTSPASGTTTASSPAVTGTVRTGASTASTPSATPPSALAEANAICARRDHELTGARLTSTSLLALAAAARRRGSIEQRALAELERLTPPAKLTTNYHRLISLNQAALLRTVKLGELARAGDAAGVRMAKAMTGQGGLALLLAAVQADLKGCGAIG